MGGVVRLDKGSGISWIMLSYPQFIQEHRFCERRWRFDYAWPKGLVAVEYEGLGNTPGRHQRITGYSNDCEKYNAAQLLGWTVLRFTAMHLPTYITQTINKAIG
jgi:hypothetical protein